MTTKTETPVDQERIFSDIERLSELASLVAAAQDALSDEMVTRLSSAFSEGITLLDRLTRNKGLMNLLQVLDRPEMQYLLLGLAEALTKTSRDIASSPPSKGGITGLCRLACKSGSQEGLVMLALLGEHLSESMRNLHRQGGTS